MMIHIYYLQIFQIMQRFNYRLDLIWSRIVADKSLLRTVLEEALREYPSDKRITNWIHRGNELFEPGFLIDLMPKASEPMNDQCPVTSGSSKGPVLGSVSPISLGMDITPTKPVKAIDVIAMEITPKKNAATVSGPTVMENVDMDITPDRNINNNFPNFKWSPEELNDDFIREVDASVERYLSSSKKKLEFDTSVITPINLESELKLEAKVLDDCSSLGSDLEELVNEVCDTENQPHDVNVHHTNIDKGKGIMYEPRPKRVIKPSAPKCSPYVDRVVVIKDKLEPDEELVLQTVVSSNKDKRYCQLFSA